MHTRLSAVRRAPPRAPNLLGIIGVAIALFQAVLLCVGPLTAHAQGTTPGEPIEEHPLPLRGVALQLAVAVFRTEDGKKHLVVHDDKTYKKSLAQTFTADTKLSGFQAVPFSPERYGVGFTAEDADYRVRYLWMLTGGSLHFAATAKDSGRTFPSKSLKSDALAAWYLTDEKAPRKLAGAVAVLAAEERSARRGNVPVFEDNIADYLEFFSNAISEVTPRTLVLQNKVCVGPGSWVCKEYKRAYIWAEGDWREPEPGELAEPPQGELVTAVDLTGDGVKERVYRTEECFRNACDYAEAVYKLNAEGSRWLVTRVTSRYNEEVGSCSDAVTEQRRLDLDLDATPLPVVRRMVRPVSHGGCEPHEGAERVEARYRWDPQSGKFETLP